MVLSALAMAEVGEKKYALSCEILGHSADVRAVSCVLLPGEAREHIVTGSRDGTACVWRPDPSSGTEYLLQKVIRKHTGYVSALCVIPPDAQAGRPQRELSFYLARTPRVSAAAAALLQLCWRRGARTPPFWSTPSLLRWRSLWRGTWATRLW